VPISSGMHVYYLRLYFGLYATKHKGTFMYHFTCREHDKKVCCLGLTSLIGLPADKIPADALDRIFKATLELLVAYKDQVAGGVSVVIAFSFGGFLFFKKHQCQTSCGPSIWPTSRTFKKINV
jgi:hypothetical protein